MPPVPPVTVLVLPMSAGTRGYGARVDKANGLILMPYNVVLDKVFADVKDATIVVMLRHRFDAFPLSDDYYDPPEVVAEKMTRPLPPVLDAESLAVPPGGFKAWVRKLLGGE